MDILLLGSVFIFICLGIPIASSIGLSVLIYFLINGGIPIMAIGQRMVAGVNEYSLLAVPLFILAGTIMNSGGITKKIFNFARSIVGHISGGLGHVNIVASIIFSGMSGAAIADAAGLGKILIRSMKEDGFDVAYSAAITAASSTLSPIIPPSIGAIIYATITGVSVGAIFMAGIIPGLVMALFMMVANYYISKKRGYPKYERSSLKEVWKAFKSAFLPLLMPFIILGGIYSGVFTATEAAVVAVVYALFIGGVVYRKFTLRSLIKDFLEAAKNSATVMFIISISSIFSWILIFERVPANLASFIISITDNSTIILLICMIFFIILGTFMEIIAIMLLTIPILHPLIIQVGIDPIHFGIVMLMSLMLGLITPPIGVVLYAVSDVGEVAIEKVSKELIYFYFVMIISVLVIIFFPQISLILPNLL